MTRCSNSRSLIFYGSCTVLQVVGVCLATGALAARAPAQAGACQAWPQLPIDALSVLVPCSAPVERRIGRLCARHEWRCGAGSFERWFDLWMRQQQEAIRVQRKLGQLILSGEHQGQSWAVFWGIEPVQTEGFAVLVSRLRVHHQE